MEKLQDAFRYLKRVHFWILCVLIVAVAIPVWFLAAGKLDEGKQTNIGIINSRYQGVSTVKGVVPHPNSDVDQGMRDLISKTREEIAQAWERKEKQQQDGALTWPEQLGQGFIDSVSVLRPIESTVPFPPDGQPILGINQTSTYRELIDTELPKLAAMIGARWNPTGLIGRAAQAITQTGEPGVGNERTRQSEPLVDWTSRSQGDIKLEHFDWSKEERGGNPTTLQILYAQEDLWVLQHLMQIIANTNEGATTRHTASVRTISSIKIGKAAVESTCQIEALRGTGDERDKSTPNTFQEMNQLNQALNSDAGDTYRGDDPAEGRYVDKDYQPLPAAKLRAVMQNPSGIEPADAYLAVAKRIPVRLRVSMDQRKIIKLLVECANSKLTVEVRQVLINPDFASSSGRAPGMANFGGQREARRSGGNAANQKQGPNQFPYDLDVEIYGIVYIYNPVNRIALGQEESNIGTAGTAGPDGASAT